MTWAPSSALAPAGPQAARLAHVYWIFFWVCAAVYVTVVAALVVALIASRQRGGAETRAAGPTSASEGSPARSSFDEPRRLRAVATAGGVTALVLVLLLVLTARAGHGLNPFHGGTADATAIVRVIGHQWWWEFRYPGAHPDDEVVTANELHIPAGVPVLLELSSRDVIHSFWVPALHGKRDLVPGHDSTTYIQADHPGIFRGQCAEFCGAQHAKMGFLVVAEDPAAYQTWLAHERQLPPAPTGAAALYGRDLFQRGTCPMCHTVAGTVAGATMGPDLSHVAGRLTLAAGTIPNVEDHLGRWVTDPQSVKEGSRMPPTPLGARDLGDLVAYLETLR